MLDPVEFGKAMAAIVNEATAPLVKRIEELEAREIPSPEPADPEEVADRVVSRLLDSDRLRTLANAQATEAVIEYFKEHPVKDGEDGDSVTDDQVTKAVARYLRENPPSKGEDGKSVTLEDVSLFLDAAIAKHVLDFERRANETLAKAIDKIPEPKDGRDGVDLTELSVDFDGERTVTVKGRTGEVTKRVPVPLWRGYWSPDVVAEKSDILTHNGTAYIAIVDNPKCEPGVGKYDHEWKVFTRKGRDGKDGRNGIDKTAPVKVKGDA